MDITSISIDASSFYRLVEDYINVNLLAAPYEVTEIDVVSDDQVIVFIRRRPEPLPAVEEHPLTAAVLEASALPDLAPVIVTPSANGDGHDPAAGHSSQHEEDGAASAPASHKSKSTISAQERDEIITLAASGLSAADIAVQLHEYPSTVTGCLNSPRNQDVIAEARRAALAVRRADAGGG